MNAPRIAVVGSSGFVGKQIMVALRQRGAEVIRITAPRLTNISVLDAQADLSHRLEGCAAVINAAGVATATSASSRPLTLANGVLPGVIARSAKSAGARMVHVSSAAVQGRIGELDSSARIEAFSPYSTSKIDGELAVRSVDGDVVIYRPPGVHHESRQTTRKLAAFARSRAASVSGQGSSPTPQALLENVADAVAYLAMHSVAPPTVVHHPSEGLTTGDLLMYLGGHSPRRLSPSLTRAVITALFSTARIRPGIAGHARRLEMLWYGQRQAVSWLTTSGWEPRFGSERWQQIGRQIANAND